MKLAEVFPDFGGWIPIFDLFPLPVDCYAIRCRFNDITRLRQFSLPQNMEYS